MTKGELIAEIAGRTDLTQDQVAEAVDGLFETVAAEMGRDGGKVTIPGFVSFQRTFRKARTGQNPQTREPIEIPARHTVKVSAGSRLKAAAE